MLKFCILLLASVSCVSSTGVIDANTYVDTILREKMPLLVRGSPQLAVIGDFSFKVSRDRTINRDMEVNMTRGTIDRLDNALQRLSDCQAPEDYEGQTIIYCYLTVQGLNVTFTALVKDDPLVAAWTIAWVNVAVRNTTAHFEASAPPGGDGTLRTFLIHDIRLDVTYDSNLSLNVHRSWKFKEEINDRVKKELMDIFQYDYKDLLSRAVESVPFPRP
nr:uncharacterized protein LOC126541364 [Dermacentor andersoni]